MSCQQPDIRAATQIQEVWQVDRPPQEAKVGPHGKKQDVQESSREHSPCQGAGTHHGAQVRIFNEVSECYCKYVCFRIVLYLCRMRALQWYLYEDDLKAGDTGEAAIIAAKNEELVHQQNISVSFHSVPLNLYDIHVLF